MDYKQDLVRFLRTEMSKIPTEKQMEKLSNPFVFCYSQARCDLLLDIDRTLELGAFFKGK